MDTVDLTVSAENADERLLIKFVDDLRRLQDLPLATVDVTRRSSSTLELLIRFPLSVFDRSATQFMAVLFGEIPFMRAFGIAKFEDLKLPAEVYRWFGGPAFGAESVLERFGATAPLLVAILKPSIDPDLTMEGLDKRIREPIAGGFHAAKDDEMQGDFVNLPLKSRLELATRNRHYVPAVNVDNVGAMSSALTRPEIRMVLVNASIMGLPALHAMRKSTKVPILSHLSMQGMFASSFSHRIFVLLHRLFGCDALITPIGDSPYYRVSKEEEMEMVGVLTETAPVAKTLPLLTGGGRLDNLSALITPYEKAKIPYGVVFGALIFNSDGRPEEMARAVVQRVSEIKASQSWS